MPNTPNAPLQRQCLAPNATRHQPLPLVLTAYARTAWGASTWQRTRLVLPRKATLGRW